MQPNPIPPNRPNLVNPAQPQFYDPSEPYRKLLMPANNQNPTSLQDVPVTNVDPKTGVIKRIPQFYYPPYDDPNNHLRERPTLIEPRAINPPGTEQPIPLSVDPYGSGPYYPYSQPYLIPLNTAVHPGEQIPTFQDHSKADIIAAHQKDADLSRLEVYHFTPKNESSSSMGTAAPPPVIQYHVYPYPPGGAPPPPPPLQQQPPSSYPYPWYGYPANGSPYAPEPPPQFLPYAETKARGSQTEPPSTKNRAVSPVHFTSIAPIYDEDGYPYIHHKKTHTDRHYLPTGRIDQRFYDSNRSTPLADCRCLDCQRERTKVLNYYPD